MSYESLFLAVWVLLILPIAVVFKTWIAPDEETERVVLMSVIWPVLLVIGIIGGGVAGSIWGFMKFLEIITNSLSERIRGRKDE